MSLVRVGVVGLGLIGGSIARRLAELPDLYEPIGFDLKNEPRGGLELADSLEQLARQAQLVIVAVPPKATPSVIAAVLGADQTVLVTDVASVKKPVIYEAPADPRYLPSHPLSGGETTGWHAARADLLQGTTWAVCPFADTSAETFCRWAEVFDAFDARLLVCDSDEHDAAVARTSHLPHVLGTAVAASLAGQPHPRLAAALSGGSLREIARVATSDPQLWEEILDLNRDNVAAARAEVRASLEGAPEWQAGHEMGELVHQLRWNVPSWERRDFAWPAWDELKQLARDGIAIRRPASAGGRLSADVAVQP